MPGIASTFVQGASITAWSTPGSRDSRNDERVVAAAIAMNAWLERLDRALGRALDWGAWLVLPVVTLLFLQWPLRDLVHGYSREANDLGQWLFALYVAMAVTVATRAHTHLAADLIARGYSPRLRVTVARAGALIGIVPWALFVLYAGSRTIANSVAGFESFPDTFNPGYFLIKIAMGLLALLALVQALIDLLRPRVPA
jgi:TRAP-type mannitol/chloroaromatic compound transport system permease small subunit